MSEQKIQLAEYQEFGNYTYAEIINKLRIADMITQANAIEFDFNDILAYHEYGEALTEELYLEYIANELMGKRVQISHKCERLIAIIESTDAFERLKPAIGDKAEMKKVFDGWRNIRNRFAHGILIFNSNQTPVAYFNGGCFDIEKSTQCFIDSQGQVISILDSYDELKSPYYGKPVFRDSTNTPDSPK
jgi:hypothetical protein